MADKETRTGNRPTMGTSMSRGFGYAKPKKGFSVGKKDAKSSGAEATKANRPNILERQGPRFRTDVKNPGPQAPEAAATGSRTVFVSSSTVRSNFWNQ